MPMKIIDVSEHNGIIKWNKVKGNVDAVIIRAGYGKGNVDKQFHENIKGAIEAGLKIGIYWFSYAFTTDMAKREAQYCNDLIEPYKDSITMPVFYDWEYDSMKYAKKNHVSLQKLEITELNLAFCNKIDDLGYKAGYYCNQDYQNNYIDTNRLKGYYKWFALYGYDDKGNSYDIWQFTDTGRVSGIVGDVDLNSSNRDISAEGYAADSGAESTEDTEEEYDMPLIKSGSKGKAVALWQIIVDAKPDGVFGAETKKATEIFQEAHGLVIDGIVGPNSWREGLKSV